ALELKAAHPDAVPIAGGTDVMVELNFDRIRPRAVIDVTRIPELNEWWPDNGRLRIGAGVTYARIIAELGDRLPGLAIASRTVGSPQIRNRGTVGGNLGSASPAGDAHPPPLADDTVVGGAAAPTPRPAAGAEEFLAAELAERGLWESRGPLAGSAVREFGDLVAQAAT